MAVPKASLSSSLQVISDSSWLFRYCRSFSRRRITASRAARSADDSVSAARASARSSALDYSHVHEKLDVRVGGGDGYVRARWVILKRKKAEVNKYKDRFSLFLAFEGDQTSICEGEKKEPVRVIPVVSDILG